MRTDSRQWIIDDEPTVAAVVRALETLSLGIVGKSLASHRRVELRAVGNVMMRLAAARMRANLGAVPGYVPTQQQTATFEALSQVASWIQDETAEPPVAALDQFHAAVVHLDTRLTSAGLSGAGWVRELGRGD